MWNGVKKHFFSEGFTYLFIFFMSFAFSGKKSTFSHSTKNHIGQWVFKVKIWFTYKTEAQSVRKTNTALFFFFEIKSELFFISFLIGIKSETRICQQKFDSRSISQTNSAENEKSRADFSFLILSAMFWYLSHRCSIKIDCAVVFSINLILEKLKSEKHALKILTKWKYDYI